MNRSKGKSRCAAIVSLFLLLWPVTCNTYAPVVYAAPHAVALSSSQIEANYYLAATYLDQAIDLQETFVRPAQRDLSVYRDVEPWTLIVITLVLIGMRLLRVRRKGLPAIG